MQKNRIQNAILIAATLIILAPQSVAVIPLLTARHKNKTYSITSCAFYLFAQIQQISVIEKEIEEIRENKLSPILNIVVISQTKRSVSL